MNICAMFGHKVKGPKGKMYLHVNAGKSCDFGDIEEYLETSGEITIPIQETRNRGIGRDE